jgi:hypothetical protein
MRFRLGETVACFGLRLKAIDPFEADFFEVEGTGSRSFRCLAMCGSALSREQHTLTPGQALKFDAALPHSYEILEDSEITILHLEKTHRF